MWKLTVEDDQGNKTTVNLVRDLYSVGRAPENTVRLTERNISRQHACFRKNGSGWTIEDQSSYNGCFVNGARVCDAHPLDHGDLVQLGDYRLKLLSEAASALNDDAPTQRPPAVAGSAEAEAASLPARLLMLAGPTPGAEFPLAGDQLIIGRGEECDISINHSSVSRVHAEVRRIGDGQFEVVDQESANGIRINGTDLQRGPLAPGDTLELGDISLRFVPAGEAYRVDSGEETLALDEGSLPPSGRPSLQGTLSRLHVTPQQLKIGGAIAAVAVIAIIAVASLGSDGTTATPETSSATDQDEVTKALNEAKALLDDGQIEAAHLMAVSSVPETSSLRDSDTFRAIESGWADYTLSRAAKDADPDKKRALLEQVAKATTVDSDRRRRAADELAALGVDGVDIDELPLKKTVAQASAPLPPAPGDEPMDLDEAYPTPQAAPAPKRKPVAAKPPPPAPAPDPRPAPPPAPAPAAANTAAEKATSGDRAAQIAAKDALKAKVAAGRGTEQDKRLLRALCRQYNDPTCAN